MPDRPSAAERRANGRALADTGRTAEAIAYLRASAADIADEDRRGAATLLVDAVQPTMLLSGRPPLYAFGSLWVAALDNNLVLRIQVDD